MTPHIYMGSKPEGCVSIIWLLQVNLTLEEMGENPLLAT